MTSQSAATLRSRYAEQAASDLEENRRRQQELGEKLRMLQQEEALLADIMKLAERAGAPADPSPLPEQAQSEAAPTGKASRRRPAPAPSRPAASRPAAERTAAPKAKAAGGAAARQPLLGTLLMELLARNDAPRPAKELREELMGEHPDREPTPQVVRNTLESLVAKGKIRRHKQERSVMYTLVAPARSRAAATKSG